MPNPKYLGDGGPDGTSVGRSATDLVALYGGTPVAQRAAAAQATSLISVTSTAVNTSIVAWMLEVSNTLIGLGAWKGSA
jgi:hypothetical protein